MPNLQLAQARVEIQDCNATIGRLNEELNGLSQELRAAEVENNDLLDESGLWGNEWLRAENRITELNRQIADKDTSIRLLGDTLNSLMASNSARTRKTQRAIDNQKKQIQILKAKLRTKKRMSGKAQIFVKPRELKDK